MASKVKTVSQESPSNLSDKTGNIVTSTLNKDRLLCQAHKLRSKSESKLSKQDSTLVELVDKLSKVESIALNIMTSSLSSSATYTPSYKQYAANKLNVKQSLVVTCQPLSRNN